MKIRFFSGRKLCALSALVLITLTVWELVVRLDSLYRPIFMFFNMAQGEGISLTTAMKYFDFAVLHQPMYLACCLIVGIRALFPARRTWTYVLLLLICLLLGITGYQIESIPLLQGWKLIRLLPLLGLSVGILLTLTSRLPRRRKPEPASPRLNDAPRLRAISHPRKENHRRGA